MFFVYCSNFVYSGLLFKIAEPDVVLYCFCHFLFGFTYFLDFLTPF